MRVEAILLPVALRLHQHHLLRESIRRVGFFRIPVPEIVFAERRGREFRISANRPERDKLLAPVQPRLFDKLHAHHQVLVKKLAGIFLVGANAADYCGQVYDQIRMRVAKAGA